ncbi:MAG: hypothetical protein ABI551_07280 [Polyangiaceae bacterium]
MLARAAATTGDRSDGNGKARERQADVGLRTSVNQATGFETAERVSKLGVAASDAVHQIGSVSHRAAAGKTKKSAQNRMFVIHDDLREATLSGA